jgi:hypothetical protein
MSAHKAAPFVIFWKLKSRFELNLRQILDAEAANSADHKLNGINLVLKEFSSSISGAPDYVSEFGFYTFHNVHEMRRIWYQHHIPNDKNLYVGVRVVFHTVQDAEHRVVRMKRTESDRIRTWRQGNGGRVGTHCRYEYVQDLESEGMG